MLPWSGLLPALPTQFTASDDLDAGAMVGHALALVEAGVDGIIALGTVGENASLSGAEKRHLLGELRRAVDGQVPLLAGVAETTTAEAAAFAADAAGIGVDGLMVLPALVYKARRAEVVAHFRAVAAASELPVMIYNNPVSYGVDVDPVTLEGLADIDRFVAIKESSEDTRRFVDLANAFGDRFALFAGVDDLLLECVGLGAAGWVSGLANAFPRESIALWRLAHGGRLAEARVLYRWFMPLLHLDTRPTLVQCIKRVCAAMGHGTAHVRPPRLPLGDAEEAEVTAILARALQERPALEPLLARADTAGN
ncbi:MAG: dihydrodipicolinate synthase family protein [Rhodothalassiaceae bacterium]